MALACTGSSGQDDTALLQPDLYVLPDTLVFDPATVGVEQDSVLRVSNRGDADLRVLTLELQGSGAFWLADAGAPLVLEPFTWVDAEITFSPVHVENEGWLVVGSDDPDSPDARFPCCFRLRYNTSATFFDKNPAASSD